MALSSEDLQQLGDFIKSEVSKAVGDVESRVADSVAEATTPKPQTNDEPQNQPVNQPDYYIHLADGSVVVSKDSQSTHMEGPEGQSLMVIGRYPKGA